MAAEIRFVDGSTLMTEPGTDFRELGRELSRDSWAEVRSEKDDLYLVRREHVISVRYVSEGS